MEPLTRFDKKSVAELRQKLGVELEAVGKKLGVSLKVGAGRYGDTFVTFKVDAALVSSSGQAMGPEVSDWAKFAEGLGLQKEWLGVEFESNGEKYVVVGLKPSSPKFPVLVKRVPGGSHVKMTAVGVQMSFLRAMGRSSPHIHLAVTGWGEAKILLGAAYDTSLEAAAAVAAKRKEPGGVETVSIFAGCTCERGSKPARTSKE